MSKSGAVFNISILSGHSAGKKKIQSDEVVIGRMDDCALTIEHPDVSRRHLVLKAKNGQVILEDLGSSNGTFVNGNKVQPKTPHVIQPTDQVKLGKVIALKVEYEFPDAAYAAAAGVTAKPEKSKGTSPLSLDPSFSEPPPQAEPQPPARKEPAPEPKIIHPVVQDAKAQAERIIEKGKKQAAMMVQEAEQLAEHKVQSFYERARKTENEAHELYKQRTQEAHAEASRIFEEAKNEGRVLVQEARKQAQLVREQAEKFAAEMQTETHKKMADLLREGEAQAQEICLQKGREADEYLQQKEQQLVKEIRDRLQEECEEQRNRLANELDEREREVNARIVVAEKRLLELMQSNLDSKMKFDEVTKESEKVALDLDSKRMQLESIRTELSSIEENSIKAKNDYESAKKTKNDIVKDLAELQTRHDVLKKEVEVLGLEKSRLNKEHEHQAQTASSEIKALKGRLEEERAKLEKEEQHHRDESKLETMRSIQKLEKEMFLEIQSNKERLTREILLLIEAGLTGDVAGERWRKLEPDFHDKVLQVLHSPSSVQTNDSAKPSTNLARARRREKLQHTLTGLAIGAIVTTSAIYGQRFFGENQSPI
ncbi:MAG TPA: FHA domain-containing protein, partial [Bdellovibrionales bacterium]|nr:FHA domain-containing protein [Bdellovibrionales bacterium]